MGNNTKIRFLNIEGKIYQVTDISFFYMMIEAVETNLAVADMSENELWDIEEFKGYKVKLINNGGKGEIVDLGEWKRNKRV